jgi:hypothetical protein
MSKPKDGETPTQWNSLVDKIATDIIAHKAEELCSLKFLDDVEDAVARLRAMLEPPASPTVTIKMRPDQAVAISKWLGEMRVYDLPDTVCDALYAICVHGRKEASVIDVTALHGSKVKP